MARHTSICLTLRDSTGVSVDSFSTDAYGTEEATITAARAMRDKLNAARAVDNPVRITRAVRVRNVNHL